MYKNVKGTAGIQGHLYETKLVSLLLLRALHDEDIEEFSIASNLSDAGAFDDICFKATLKGHVRPVTFFLQAKHKKYTKGIHTLSSENTLIKYYDSFLKIKHKFHPEAEEEMFSGRFDDTDCVFIIYTNEKGDESNVTYESNVADLLNRLIATGNIGSQPLCTDNHVRLLSRINLEKEMTKLAEHFANFLCDETRPNIMSDEYISRYHVILADKVLNISEIKSEGHRIGMFRNEFHDTTDECLLLFRDKLYKEVLKRRKLTEETEQIFILHFLTTPTDNTLQRVIERIIIHENGKFKFRFEMPLDAKEKLEKISFPQYQIEKATADAASIVISQIRLKLPASFGNRDLTMCPGKIERRINYLTFRICELIEMTKPNKIITLDDQIEDGLLAFNGGLGSAVGNILVYDNDTKLMKFTENSGYLEERAKLFLTKLQSQIPDLQEYRFDVKTMKLPKLSFDHKYVNDDLIRSFFNKLVFYTDQACESGVERIVKREIENLQSTHVHQIRIKTNAIFLEYHDQIQKWWMSEKNVPYLTKTCDKYEQAINNIINNPLTGIVSSIYLNKIKTAQCKFNEATAACFDFQDVFLSTIIVTDTTMLTVAKLIQSLKTQKFAILDLCYIFKMLPHEFEALNLELKDTYQDSIIIVCDSFINIKNQNKQQRLKSFAQAVVSKRSVFVTNGVFFDVIRTCFPWITRVITDKKPCLTDLDEESQINITKHTQVLFQGQEITLNSLLDDTSAGFVNGAMLDDIIESKSIVMGQSLVSCNYDDIKDLYVHRRVCDDNENMHVGIPKGKVLNTLFDITDNVVLLTAKPGMGKSTLLTHLALKTKELHPKVWVVRIDLLEYSIEFSKWQKDKTVIDLMETMKFLCHVIIERKMTKNVSIVLQEIDGDLRLQESTGDDWTTFELNMFLYFYNNEEIIFLFDGFDEICPHYVTEVLTLLTCLKNNIRKNKMWITSRTYNAIQTVLHQHFGTPYSLQPFDPKDQDVVLDKFWHKKININELNEAQLDNVDDFIDFMWKLDEKFDRDGSYLTETINHPFLQIYSSFTNYLNSGSLNLKNNEKLKAIRIAKTLPNVLHTLYMVFYVQRELLSCLSFSGTPLHLYLIADCLVNKIKDVNRESNSWDLDDTKCTLIESFVETKLMKIRFQEKNKLDVHRPDVKMTCKAERNKFIATHKKLAAYALFHVNGLKIFSKKELKNVKDLIRKIKTGKEKNGFIQKISNNIPQFVHMIFAEYFAEEYLKDLLKSANDTQKQKIQHLVQMVCSQTAGPPLNPFYHIHYKSGKGSNE